MQIFSGKNLLLQLIKCDYLLILSLRCTVYLKTSSSVSCRSSTNEVKNLMQSLPRTSEPREMLFEDRTRAHADHIGQGFERETTAAVGVLKAVQSGDRWAVTCFTATYIKMSCNPAKYVPPPSQLGASSCNQRRRVFPRCWFPSSSSEAAVGPTRTSTVTGLSHTHTHTHTQTWGIAISTAQLAI